MYPIVDFEKIDASSDGYYRPVKFTVENIISYVNERIPTGDFLRAVLENNLIEAFGRADSNNTRYLKEICSFVYMYVPRDAWGSKEAVDNWLKEKK